MCVLYLIDVLLTDFPWLNLNYLLKFVLRFMNLYVSLKTHSFICLVVLLVYIPMAEVVLLIRTAWKYLRPIVSNLFYVFVGAL